MLKMFELRRGARDAASAALSTQQAQAAQRALWARTRRPEKDSDQALNGTARHWLRQLPTRRRPLRLCAVYPRIANRIAWCWRDRELRAQVLDDLIRDRRGGRRGFEPAIVRELQRLRDFNDQLPVGVPDETLLGSIARLVDGR